MFKDEPIDKEAELVGDYVQQLLDGLLLMELEDCFEHSQVLNDQLCFWLRDQANELMTDDFYNMYKGYKLGDALRLWIVNYIVTDNEELEKYARERLSDD